MRPPPPPEEIAELMQFIALKSKGVKSPMNLQHLCRQFKEETGSQLSEGCVRSRILTNRRIIYKMSEFDMDTKVEMMFALSSPIAAEFLIELKKHGEVEVDDERRIIRFKKTGGGLELSGKHFVSTRQQNERDIGMVRFLIEKSITVQIPICGSSFVREYKEKTGDTSSIYALQKVYERVKSTIFELRGIDKNIKIKMAFISNAKVSEEILEELRKDAEVEVDEKGRITKYRANDGSLELEGDHSMSAMVLAAKADIERQREKGRKRTREDSEKGDDGASLNVEDESPMDFETNNVEAYYYEPPIYEDNIDHIPVEMKPELLLEVKTEEPSTSNGGYRYEDSVFDYNPPNYEEHMDHVPAEKKPESLVEVKIEEPDGPSTSNLEYYYEENWSIL